jgi:hypothetical protein
MFRRALLPLLIITLHALSSSADSAQTYDLVIAHGRVLDPETQLDQTLNIGISNGKIASLSREPLVGKHYIDAQGLLVAPGFIDLHSHAVTPTGQRYQLFDGVTTALELEAGAYPADRVGQSLDSKALINYGGSLGYLWLRQWRLSDRYQASLVHTVAEAEGRNPEWEALSPQSVFTESLSQKHISELQSAIKDEWRKGHSLGIGLPIDYLKFGLSDAELNAIFTTAAELDAIVFIHARRTPVGDLGGLNELIELARTSGAAIHFCHLNSNALKSISDYLELIERVRVEGLDLSTEAYPYEAGSTQIGAAAFKGDWQTLYGMDFDDIVWVATGERLTEASFHDYQHQTPEGYIVLFSNDMASVDQAMLDPQTIVASDAMPAPSDDAKVHPRGRGTFTRTLHRYVREQNALSWLDAIEKMTLLPARRLEHMAPSFARKGRIQLGMDADIVAFDPNRVQDQASYEDPNQPSMGMQYVLVNGTPIVQRGKLVDGVYPGLRITLTGHR